MVAEERRTQLLEMVRVRGFASLPELAGELAVSESTVRRDLELLEEQGVAKRTHGGVFYTGQSPEFPHFKDRQEAQWDKKRALARIAAGLIEDGDTLLLDGGSTTYEVARLLVGRPLHVVTNSMPVANLLASQTDSDLVFVGGNVLKRSGTTIGPYADAMLELSPPEFAGHVVRVHCLAELGRGAEAKALLDRLLKDFPSRAKEVEELRRSLAGLLPN